MGVVEGTHAVLYLQGDSVEELYVAAVCNVLEEEDRGNECLTSGKRCVCVCVCVCVCSFVLILYHDSECHSHIVSCCV